MSAPASSSTAPPSLIQISAPVATSYHAGSDQHPTAICHLPNTEECALVVDAVRRGDLRPVTRRLDVEEAARIRHGTVWVWQEAISVEDDDESVSPAVSGPSKPARTQDDGGPHPVDSSGSPPSFLGIRRWTDGRRWGASRVNKSGFLVYVEIERVFKTGAPRTVESVKKDKGKGKVGPGATLPWESQRGGKRKRQVDDEGETAPIGTAPAGPSTSVMTPAGQDNLFPGRLPPGIATSLPPVSSSSPLSSPSSILSGPPSPNAPPYPPITHLKPTSERSPQRSAMTFEQKSHSSRPTHTDRHGVPANRKAKPDGLIKQSWSVVLEDLEADSGDRSLDPAGRPTTGRLMELGEPRVSAETARTALEQASLRRQSGAGHLRVRATRWHVVAYYSQNPESHPPIPLASQLPSIIPYMTQARASSTLSNAAARTSLRAGSNIHGSAPRQALVGMGELDPSKWLGRIRRGQDAERELPRKIPVKRNRDKTEMAEDTAALPSSHMDEAGSSTTKKVRRAKKSDEAVGAAADAIGKQPSESGHSGKMFRGHTAAEDVGKSSAFDPTANAFPVLARKRQHPQASRRQMAKRLSGTIERPSRSGDLGPQVGSDSPGPSYTYSQHPSSSVWVTIPHGGEHAPNASGQGYGGSGATTNAGAHPPHFPQMVFDPGLGIPDTQYLPVALLSHDGAPDSWATATCTPTNQDPTYVPTTHQGDPFDLPGHASYPPQRSMPQFGNDADRGPGDPRRLPEQGMRLGTGYVSWSVPSSNETGQRMSRRSDPAGSPAISGEVYATMPDGTVFRPEQPPGSVVYTQSSGTINQKESHMSYTIGGTGQYLGNEVAYPSAGWFSASPDMSWTNHPSANAEVATFEPSIPAIITTETTRPMLPRTREPSRNPPPPPLNLGPTPTTTILNRTRPLVPVSVSPDAVPKTNPNPPPSFMITTPNGTAGPFVSNDPYFDAEPDDASISRVTCGRTPIGLGIVTGSAAERVFPLGSEAFGSVAVERNASQGFLMGWSPEMDPSAEPLTSTTATPRPTEATVAPALETVEVIPMDPVAGALTILPSTNQHDVQPAKPSSSIESAEVCEGIPGPDLS